jgi:hypothetical protein
LLGSSLRDAGTFKPSGSRGVETSSIKPSSGSDFQRRNQ